MRSKIAGFFLVGASVPVLFGQTAPPSAVPAVGDAAAQAYLQPPTGQGRLGQQILALLNEPAARSAHWGIAVTALDGTPIFGVNQEKLFRPASTAKLFTSTAAIALLGPDHRASTQVIAEGTTTQGVLHGNLVLHGDGDANLAGANHLPYSRSSPAPAAANPLADLDALAQAVAAKGIRVIEGDVIGDDTAFGDPPYPEGWGTDDLLWGYGAPVSALTLHDNLVDVTVAPTTPSSPGIVTFSPDVPYYRLNPIQNPDDPAQAITPRVYTSQDRTLLRLDRSPNSLDLFVIGDIRQGGPPAHEQVAIADPAAFAAIAFRTALERNGVTVHGATRPRHRSSGDLAPFLTEAGQPDPTIRSMLSRFPGGWHSSCNAQTVYQPGAPEQAVLATREGPPLAEDLVLTLKTSQNLHAELMLRSLSELTCGEGLGKSVAIVRSFLAEAGIDNSDIVLYDGSGLSTKDLVTPRATAQLLAFAAKQPWFEQWFAGLPVGGVDGTLSSRFTDPPLKGHVFAKTGTLGESRALAGYLDARSGRRLIFTIFVDNHLAGTSGDRSIMDRIVAAIAAAN